MPFAFLRTLCLAAVFGLGARGGAAAPTAPPRWPWLDPSIDFDTRARWLVGNMTDTERIQQLVKYSVPVPRLGVPGYAWHEEAAHGVATGGDVTVFPCSLARAAAFDVPLEREVAAVTRVEARAKWNMYLSSTGGAPPPYNSDGLSLTLYAPEMNICRDPRWGRCQQSRGEDPHLTSRLTVAFVEALQDGNGSKYLPVAAMLKDFPVYNLESDQPVGGTDWQERLRYNAVVNLADMQQTFLPAFRAGTVEAGVATVMTSYHAINGIPATAHPMLQAVLRDEWGWKGSVVSDGGAVTFILDFNYTGLPMTDNITAAAAAALNAGCDMNSGGFERVLNPEGCAGCAPNMTGYAYAHLLEALRTGMVDSATIQRSATRLLRLRMQLGLFDPPDATPFASLGWRDVDTAASRALARKSAQEALVLLQTDGGLPLDAAKLKRLAVIGPLANSTGVLLSDYNACGPKYVNSGMPGRKCTLVSVLAGARAALANTTEVTYSGGCGLTDPDESGIGPAADAAAAADAAVVVVGLISGNGKEHATLEGEAHDRVNLTLPGKQLELVQAVLRKQPRTIVVLVSGSALAVPEIMDPPAGTPRPMAIVQQFYAGEQGGNALMDALLGASEFTGRLPITVFCGLGDLPPYLEQDMALAKGRTYRYFTGEPLYPFGYGATRTAFSYSELKVTPTVVLASGATGAVEVSFVISASGGDGAGAGTTTTRDSSGSSSNNNSVGISRGTGTGTGASLADEVVQVYVSFKPDATARPWGGGRQLPRWELKHFERVPVSRGGSRAVSVTVNASSLELSGETGDLELLVGTYTFHVGGTSPGTPSRLLRPAAPWGPAAPVSASVHIRRRS